jgi:hypothetical protein
MQRIKVHRVGQIKTYDLGMATKNGNVAKIFNDLLDKLNEVTPKLLADP